MSAFIQRYYENHHSQSHFTYGKSHQIITYNRDQRVREIQQSWELIITTFEIEVDVKSIISNFTTFEQYYSLNIAQIPAVVNRQ